MELENERRQMELENRRRQMELENERRQMELEDRRRQMVLEKLGQEWRSAIESQEKRIQDLQSTAFQLANYYFVFQGVIITAISNGTSALGCRDRWFLITLSAIAASLNVASLCFVGMKYKTSLDRLDDMWYFDGFILAGAPGPPPERPPLTSRKRLIFLVISMLLFIAFAVITIVGCGLLLCRTRQCINLGGQHR